MFSLYIFIDHIKLLKKTSTIDNNIESSISNIIIRKGGDVSSFSAFYSEFPSKYEYSKKNFIICLQDIIKELKSISDLVGYSIVVDCNEVIDEYDYLEKSRKLKLLIKDINKLWFTTDAYTRVSHLVYGEIAPDLVKIYDTFINTQLELNNDFNKYISKDIQTFLENDSSSIKIYNSKFSMVNNNNLQYFGSKRGFEKFHYIDLGQSCDKILTILDYIISLRDEFDPLVDLNKKETVYWGSYVDLYSKFLNRNYDCYILDDALVHFNKLLLLWFESYTNRNKTQLIIRITDYTELDFLWSMLSIINNLEIYIFTDSSDVPKWPVREVVPTVEFKKVLKNKDIDSIMVLFLLLKLEGSMLLKDVLFIIGRYNENSLILREEIDNYRRIGFFIGDHYLYPGYYELITYIEDIYAENLKDWINQFVKASIDCGYSKIFSYSYYISLVGLESAYIDESINLIYNYVKKLLDMGRYSTLSTKYYTYSKDNKSLKSILQYKELRESRLNFEITKNRSVDNRDEKYSKIIEYQILLNEWSLNENDDVLDRVKKLYFYYQDNEEKFQESRVKILFALLLLSRGSVDEAIDYFELNLNFSKNISDTFSFIRNVCFLSASLFIKGDISGVLRITGRYIDHPWLFFKKRWLIHLKFIRARALAEIGSYDDSLTLIIESIVIAKNFNYEDILIPLNNWKGKILFYMDRGGEARETLLVNNDSNEKFFFLSEIEYHSGNIDKAIEYINKCDLLVDYNYLFDEKLKWRDGFFVIEEFFKRDRSNSILFEEISNFKTFLLTNKGNEESYKEFIKIVNNVENSSILINDYKYLFYFYLATKDNDNFNIINKSNVFNKSVRLLQQRGSQMSEHNQRHLYFSNFINAKLMEILKNKKLY